jgi:hypothetical protein
MQHDSQHGSGMREHEQVSDSHQGNGGCGGSRIRGLGMQQLVGSTWEVAGRTACACVWREGGEGLCTK